MSIMTEPTIFVRRWTQLADELKLKILRHALPANETMVHIQFNTKHRDRTVSTANNMGRKDDIPKEWFLFDNEVLPLLACPPIAALAREAFYTQNTFTLGGNSSWRMLRRADAFGGPLASKVRPYVRRTVLQLSPHPDTIRAFAHITSWFPNLHVCQINFDCWDNLKDEKKAAFRDFVMQMAPIELPTKKLVLEHKEYPDDYFEPGTTTLTDFAELLMGKITIAVPEGKDRTESWERFTFEARKFCITPGKTIQHFDAWPMVVESDGYGRLTRKTVQATGLSKL